MIDVYLQCIVCFIEEFIEVFYVFGEEYCIVGIFGFMVWLLWVCKEKLKVLVFISVKIGEIFVFKFDLVIGFFDIQVDIVCELIKVGVEVWIFNYCSVGGIFVYICWFGVMVGVYDKVEVYVQCVEVYIVVVCEVVVVLLWWLKVYFEEWDELIIIGICWVVELINFVGGDDIFFELVCELLVKQWILVDGMLVIVCVLDIIFGLWCGKCFCLEKVVVWLGWDVIFVVCDGEFYEIKLLIILQFGFVVLFDGFEVMYQVIVCWVLWV